jgi:hypothetical protein
MGPASVNLPLLGPFGRPASSTEADGGELKARRLATGQKFIEISDSGHQHFVEEKQCCLGRSFTDRFTVPAEDLV